MAFGVALFPTNPENAADKIYTLIPYNIQWLGGLHYGFAGILFLIFAWLAFAVFTLGQARNMDIPKSVFNENNIYIFCGSLIVISILCIALHGIFPKFLALYNITLICEAVSLFAFGTAWLIKGRALGDKGILGKKLYRE